MPKILVISIPSTLYTTQVSHAYLPAADQIMDVTDEEFAILVEHLNNTAADKYGNVHKVIRIYTQEETKEKIEGAVNLAKKRIAALAAKRQATEARMVKRRVEEIVRNASALGTVVRIKSSQMKFVPKDLLKFVEEVNDVNDSD